MIGIGFLLMLLGFLTTMVVIMLRLFCSKAKKWHLITLLCLSFIMFFSGGDILTGKALITSISKATLLTLAVLLFEFIMHCGEDKESF